MKIFNLNGDEWDRVEDRPGWQSKDAWVGAHIGAELLGASLYELEPGSRLWPYHTHHANEEWVIVFRGRATLRSPEGEETLSEGDVVCFPRGEQGLHQIRNDSEAPVRLLMLSTLLQPDVVEYPDSGKVSAIDARGQRLFRTFRGKDAEYWEGEA